MNNDFYMGVPTYAARRTNAIAHIGIPGMKWGNRRYQNADGTWTELGKARRRVGQSGFSERTKARLDVALTPSIKGGKDKPPVSPTQQIIKETQNINSNISDINRTRRERAVRVDKTAKSMSDEELRASIQRMNLEHQYSRLKEDEVSSGYMFIQDALDIMGSTLGMLGSVAVIAAAVNTVLKAGGDE